MDPPTLKKSGWEVYSKQNCDVCKNPEHEASECSDPRRHEQPVCKRCGHWRHKTNACGLNDDDLDFFTPKCRAAFIEKRDAALAKSSTKVQKPSKEKGTPKASSLAGGTQKHSATLKFSNVQNQPGSTSNTQQKNSQPAIAASSQTLPIHVRTTDGKQATAPEKKKSPEQLRKEKRKEETDDKMKSSKEFNKGFVLKPSKTSSGGRPRTVTSANVLTNFFEVTVDSEQKLYKYRITVGEIPIDNGRIPKKRETKRAMILSLMLSLAAVNPGLTWASDFYEIVLTTTKIFDHPAVDSISHTHQRTGRQPSTTEPIRSTVTFEKELPLEDVRAYCQRQAENHELYGTALFNSANHVLSMFNIVSWKKINDTSDIGQVGKKFYPVFGSARVAKPNKYSPAQKDLEWFVVEEDAFDGRLGFFTSMRTGDGKIVMNINTTTSIFFAQVTLDKWLDSKDCSIPQHKRFLALKGVKVEIRAPEENVRVIFQIKSGSHHSTRKTDPREENESLPDGEENKKNWKMETIESHLRARKRWPYFDHQIRRVVMNVGTVNESKWVGIDSRDKLFPEKMRYVNVGNDSRPDWYPVHQATIRPFVPYKTKLQNAVMVKAAERSPTQNMSRIRSALVAMGVRGPPLWQDNTNLNSFGIRRIDSTFISCVANELGTPKVCFRGNQEISMDKNGGWSNLGKQFARVEQNSCSKLRYIHITIGQELISQDEKSDLSDGVDKLRKSLRDNGIIGDNNVLCTTVNLNSDCNRTTFKQRMNDALKRLYQGSPKEEAKNNPMLIILPKRDIELYANVKWWSDCHAGIATICVQKAKLLPSWDQSTKKYKPVDGKTLGNLSLKFNYKSGGTNHVLDATSNKWAERFSNTMVMGADVTHSGQGNHSPSLAAVVASYSTEPTYSSHYLGSARLQESHMEYIADLKGMVAERVRKWFSHNKRKLPANILFYRDGVSESQFDLVKTLEFVQIEEGFNEAAKSLNLSSIPKVKITLLVVGKRHHTRFYPTEKQYDGNCPAGTVVDTEIINPNHFSFYLQSHKSRLGTARSAHYFVIRNEMELAATELHDFTMNLCYTTSKSVMPLSICPPARYADALCNRLRCYMRPALEGDEEQNKHHEEDGTYQEDVARYKSDSTTWSADPQRENPWDTALDDIMFYL